MGGSLGALYTLLREAAFHFDAVIKSKTALVNLQRYRGAEVPKIFIHPNTSDDGGDGHASNESLTCLDPAKVQHHCRDFEALDMLCTCSEFKGLCP